MSRSDDDAEDYFRQGNRGNAAFLAGERLPDDASDGFRAAWVGAALEARAKLAALGPLAENARSVGRVLDAATFALKNYTSAKLLPTQEKQLRQTRIDVAWARGLLPDDAAPGASAAMLGSAESADAQHRSTKSASEGASTAPVGTGQPKAPAKNPAAGAEAQRVIAERCDQASATPPRAGLAGDRAAAVRGVRACAPPPPGSNSNHGGY